MRISRNVPLLDDSSDSGRTTVVVRQKKRKKTSKERLLTTPRSAAEKISKTLGGSRTGGRAAKARGRWKNVEKIAVFYLGPTLLGIGGEPEQVGT